jgi:hypothetical protein
MTITVRLLALSILLAASSAARAKDSDQPDLEALSMLPVYGASR